MMRWIIVALLLGGACSPPEDQETGSIEQEDVRSARHELAPATRAQLDSGNAAFREKDWERALRHYREVTRLDAETTAGWFGVYMVEQARGNAAAADSALEKAQSLQPGATLLR
jgi:hypothetical protein